MKLLLLGLNYAPEPVGIGPYTAGMAEWLAQRGHEVTVVCGKPYYPAWKQSPGYDDGLYLRSVENGVTVVRCPIYIPAKPTGLRRLIHHASFALTVLPVVLARARRWKPDGVMTVAPSLIASPVARMGARLVNAPFWVHVQDFEVEAAVATGLLRSKSATARLAQRFETWCLHANMISTISPQMCRKLEEKGIDRDKIFEFRNWAHIENITPMEQPSGFRDEWKINRPHVVLYSGNIANKQGIDVLVEAAKYLASRRDIMFVICGSGPNQDKLARSARGLDNIQFHPLQPMDRLSDLLGLATVHVLPQIAGAADLVLPSKLTNMLASGRPVVVTAPPATGLAQEIEGCGVVAPPGNPKALAAAIVDLIDDAPTRERYGAEARLRAEDRWSKARILEHFEEQLLALTAGAPAAQQPAIHLAGQV